MSYPGNGQHTYGGRPPPGPPPQGNYNYNTGQYQPPAGPPPATGPRPNGYGAPSNGGGYHQYNNGNNYGPPQGAPPPQNYQGRGDQRQQQDGQQYHQGQTYHQSNQGYNAPPPNTQPQSFGVNGLTPYQYSNCSGRRKALCIGINYIGTSNELRGCINDARAVSKMLQQMYGYKEDDIVMLTDDSQNPRAIPTKANMIAAMQWLVRGAQTNDSLFLHYSGHGGQTQDLDGDEDDGYDEVIYPLDFQTAGHIVDDDLHDLVVKPLMPGVRLTALFDSCHSGTVLDLPYVYSTKGVLKEPNLAKDAGMGLLQGVISYERGDLMGMVNNLGGVFKKVTRGNQATQQTKQTKTSPADVVMFSGCKDSQTSADTQSAGVNTGAVSYAFLDVISRNPEQSYLSLLNQMRDAMTGKYSQKPQLSCCHPLDVNLKFLL